MEDLADQIKKGEMNDVAGRIPGCNALLASWAVLGPRGLSLNSESRYRNLNVAEAVKNAKAGQVRYRNDKTASSTPATTVKWT